MSFLPLFLASSFLVLTSCSLFLREAPQVALDILNLDQSQFVVIFTSDSIQTTKENNKLILSEQTKPDAASPYGKTSYALNLVYTPDTKILEIDKDFFTLIGFNPSVYKISTSQLENYKKQAAKEDILYSFDLSLCKKNINETEEKEEAALGYSVLIKESSQDSWKRLYWQSIPAQKVIASCPKL